MFAGKGPAVFDTDRKDLFSGQIGVFNFFGDIIAVEDQWMEITVTCMKNIGHGKTEFAAHLGDFIQHLRK